MQSVPITTKVVGSNSVHDLQLPMQSVHITTKAVSSNSVHDEVHSIQHYVIKFVSSLQQVGGFLWVFRFSPTNKTDHHDIAEILLKVALNTINQTINKETGISFQF